MTIHSIVEEYVEVFQPVCCGLDVLQGEKEVGLGHLLPTLSVIKGQLTDLLAHNKLSMCGPVVQLLLNGIAKRFQFMLSNTDAQLAAIVHPKFKIDWVMDEDEKTRLLNILKRRMQSVAVQASTSQPTDNPGEPPASTSTSTSTASQKRDFFAVLAARRQQAISGINCDVDEELAKYLSDSSSDVTSLNVYPNIRKLYISLNTGLPASAAVERLFSLGGRVFSPLRARLSSNHFEMMMFLRCAKF
jgi:hypothetical protein